MTLCIILLPIGLFYELRRYQAEKFLWHLGSIENLKEISQKIEYVKLADIPELFERFYGNLPVVIFTDSCLLSEAPRT